MTTPAERLAAILHLESAAIAPQTSPLIEAAKEVLGENESLRAALIGMVDMYCALVNSGGAGFWDPEKVDEVKRARNALALSQQLSVNSEEGK